MLGAVPMVPNSVTYAATNQPVVTVTHPKLNTIKLSWKSIGGADGYNIYMKQSESGTLSRIASVKTTSFSTIGLNKDTTYYFQVVPYTITNKSMTEGTPSSTIVEKANREGIDVSYAQGNINWTKVASTGIQFVMLRLGYGGIRTADSSHCNNLDVTFTTNIQKAQQEGIPVGIYYYTLARNEKEAVNEANYVVSQLKKYQITYPVAMDIESSVLQALSTTQNVKNVKAFCNVIKKAGYQTMVYCNLDFMKNHLVYSDIASYSVWLAQPDGELTFTKPISMWQYTKVARVDGITENVVDMNYDLDEKDTINGSTVYNVSSKKFYYYAKANETIATIGTKLGLTSSELIKWNTSYKATTKLSAGKALLLGTVRLSKVAGVSITNIGMNQMTVKWNSVTGADGYYVERATSAHDTYSLVCDTTGTSFTNKSLEFNKGYYYRVRAYRTGLNGLIIGAVSSVSSAKTQLAKTSSLKTSATYNSATLTWAKVTGATNYRIYRATSKSGKYSLIKTVSSSTTSYKNSGLTTNKTYYYKVVAIRAVTMNGKKVTYTGISSSIVSAKPSFTKPVIQSMTSKKYSIRLGWGKVSGANGYAIYRSNSKNGTYSRIAYTTKTYYNNKKLKSNKTYYYKIRAYRTVDGVKKYSNYSSIKYKKTTK